MTRRTTKASQIAAFLEDAIISGHLPEGIVLRQEKLSEEFGVSRMPVREALRQLVAAGVASFEPRRGVRVRSISHADVRDAFLIRAELEGLAAEFAAARMTQTDLVALRHAQTQCVEVGRRLATRVSDAHDVAGMPPEWVSANDAFHDVILDAAGAPLIQQMARSVRRLFHGQAAWVGNPALHEVYSRSLEQHNGLCEAVGDGDSVGARNLARTHVLDAAKYFDAALEHTGERGNRLFPPGVTWDEEGHPILLQDEPEHAVAASGRELSV